MKRTIIIFTALIIYSLIGCAQVDPAANISIVQLKEKMSNDTSLVILDVRTHQELSGPLGKLDGVINIPVQELSQRINELDTYKGREIAVICRTGNRSGSATTILRKEGFNAKNVLGGMVEYRNSGTKN
ncbi:MAG: rhodanese-like domain-containing protein [Ignavibacteriales bacterium]|nr:MAG: rhodanese-like domain-containing protein [Ignavibacteriales bacterium]